MAVLFISSPLSLVRLIRKIFLTTVPFRSLYPSSLIPFFTLFDFHYKNLCHLRGLTISLADPMYHFEDDMNTVNLVCVRCSDLYFFFFAYVLLDYDTIQSCR